MSYKFKKLVLTYEILQRTPREAILSVSTKNGVLGFEVFKMLPSNVRELKARMGMHNLKITMPVYDSYLSSQHFADGCTFFRELKDAIKAFMLSQCKSKPPVPISKITLLSYAEDSIENAQQGDLDPKRATQRKKKEKAA